MLEVEQETIAAAPDKHNEEAKEESKREEPSLIGDPQESSDEDFEVKQKVQ